MVVLVLVVILPAAGVGLAGFALATARSPTKEAAPSAPPGWHVTFRDNFNGHSLNLSKWWGSYSGQPGGDPTGYWAPSHVLVEHGFLVLRTYRASTPLGRRWVSGGIGQRASLAQTYGRYLVRMRVTTGPGISALALLYPVKGWPPEIDFYEDAPTGKRRIGMAATLHYSPGNRQIQRSLRGVNFEHWHTVGLDWSPGKLVYTIDGRKWATVRSHAVPSQPMTLDLQTQALTCGASNRSCPNASTPALVEMYVAWVRIYARNEP